MSNRHGLLLALDFLAALPIIVASYVLALALIAFAADAAAGATAVAARQARGATSVRRCREPDSYAQARPYATGA